MSRLTAWDDPHVKAALLQRPPDDIYLMICHGCGRYSYYNQGSHFSCTWCDWSMSGRQLDLALDAGEAITLDDYAELPADDLDIPF